MVIAAVLAAAVALAPYVPQLEPGDTVPAIPLVDQTGRAFSLASLRGRAVVVTFMYTRCADARMCPLTSAKFERMQTATRDMPIRLLEISLDPGFDSPHVLNAYGRAYHADPLHWQLATGAPASIAGLAGRFGIATRWSAPGTLVHSEGVAVLDRQGRLVTNIEGNAWRPEDVVAIARGAGDAGTSLAARLALALGAAVELCGGRSGPNGFALFGLLFASLVASLTIVLRALRPRARS